MFAEAVDQDFLVKDPGGSTEVAGKLKGDGQDDTDLEPVARGG